MRKPKVLPKLIVVVSLIFSIIVLFSHKKTAALSELDILKGYVDFSDISSEESYYETKLRSLEFVPPKKLGESLNTSHQPQIAGKIGLLIDAKTGNVLFEKDAYTRKEIASLVKIMTALVAIEHADLDQLVYISESAARVGENTMGISAGEVYTLKELLFGLIMQSGNDSAYAISEGVAGSTEIFVDWMNIKAAELGLTNTYFADPSGLDDKTYSTAADLARLTVYALQYPEFREVSTTLETELISNTHKYLPLYNQTNLLSTYPGVAGVKTGYTEVAGLCLVTYAQNDGREVVGIVLDSPDRKGDMILMLDHGFSTLGVTINHNLL